MKSKLVSGVVLALTLIAPLAFAQTPPAGAAPAAAPPAAAPAPAAAPPAAAPPGPTEAAPTPEAAPVYGQEQPPPPTYETQPATEPVVLAPPSESEPPPSPKRDAGPFSKGSIGLTVLAGSASIGDKWWMIIGAGVGYFVVDGLEVGVEGQAWIFDEPVVGTVTPQVRYILHMVPVLKPYVGTFYRRYIIGDDINDFSSVGARAGAILVPGKSRTYIGLGAIYEHVLDDQAFLSSDEWYPEITVGISL